MVNFNAMLKQAQAMQAKMMDAQTKIEQHTVDGSSGGGMVKVSMSGKGDLKTIKIDSNLLLPEDVEVLEDLIIAAFRDAKEKAEAYASQEMSGMAGGFELPAGMKLPF